MPEGMNGEGENGVERWQDDVPTDRRIKTEDRNWIVLPHTGRDDYRPWLRKFALQTLRHDNIHEPGDGGVHFTIFLKTMTRKIWKYSKEECRKVCRSPLHLLQALMTASPLPTFGAAWFMGATPSFGDLKWSKYGETSHSEMARLIPIYIRAIHGHSRIDRTLPIPSEKGWQVTARHKLRVPLWKE